MSVQRVNRRAFLHVAGIGAIAAGVAGCGGAAPVVVQATRVVVQVSWRYLSKLLKAVVSRDGKLILAALMGAEEVAMSAQLTEAQQRDIRKGGVLILRTEDGKEHEVPFTVEK